MQALFILLIIAILVFLGGTLSTVFVVRQQSVAIIERFGRYHKIASSGIHSRLPFGIDKIASRIQKPTQPRSLPISIGRGIGE